jgi:deazaflavin-dependent oxidoreductase (nitroreductase family)
MSRSTLRPPDARLFRALYAVGLGPIVGRLILLLTTTGRRTGRKRVTALQYEEVAGAYWLGSSRGMRADWVRNLLADPIVEVQVRSRRFRGRAEAVDDAQRVADFLELRLERHPRMIGRILEMEGLPARPSRQQLVTYAARLALVIVRPLAGDESAGNARTRDATMVP